MLAVPMRLHYFHIFNIICSVYLQQSDGEGVAQLWQRLIEPGGSPGCTLLFDPSGTKTLLIMAPSG